MADTATRLLSGRAPGQAQPVEVHLVMTDRALIGTGDPGRSVFEPARVPGHGSVPAPVARAWLRRGLDVPSAGRGLDVQSAGHGVDAPSTGPGIDAASAGDDGGGAARVWLRRLYTSPDGRDLVAMDSRRRLFTGLLRRMLVLRDDVCTTPWCEAPIAHADHTVPARDGSPTSFTAGNGKCARCNLGKEAPGWSNQVVIMRAAPTPRDTEEGTEQREQLPGSPGRARRALEVTTPLGRVYESQPPPLLGWGSAPVGHESYSPPLGGEDDSAGADSDSRGGVAANREPPAAQPAGCATPGRTRVQRWAPGRKRPRRRARALPSAGRNRPPTRRPRLTSHLERELCRLLT